MRPPKNLYIPDFSKLAHPWWEFSHVTQLFSYFFWQYCFRRKLAVSDRMPKLLTWIQLALSHCALSLFSETKWYSSLLCTCRWIIYPEIKFHYVYNFIEVFFVSLNEIIFFSQNFMNIPRIFFGIFDFVFCVSFHLDYWARSNFQTEEQGWVFRTLYGASLLRQFPPSHVGRSWSEPLATVLEEADQLPNAALWALAFPTQHCEVLQCYLSNSTSIITLPICLSMVDIYFKGFNSHPKRNLFSALLWDMDGTSRNSNLSLLPPRFLSLLYPDRIAETRPPLPHRRPALRQGFFWLEILCEVLWHSILSAPSITPKSGLCKPTDFNWEGLPVNSPSEKFENPPILFSNQTHCGQTICNGICS